MPPKSFFGNKICQQCLDSAINAYIFTHKSYNIRRRLEVCLTKAIDKLEDIKPDKNIIIEVDKDLIMPVKEIDLIRDGINSFIEEQDENKLHVEVLEDKYRNEEDTKIKVKKIKSPKEIDAKINGIAFVEKTMDVSEFLTFKTKKVKKVLLKFTCPMCNKHFVSEYFLKKHLLRHINRKACCQTCKQPFVNIFALKEHERMAHILNRSYIACKICFRAFDCKYKLDKHKKSHRRKLCQLCDKVFKSQRFYDIHLQRHAIKFKNLRATHKMLSCSFCEKQFLNRNSVDIHINKAHFQMRPYSCDMCESKFYTKANLNSHKKVHRIYSKEKCEFCDKVLFTRKSLVIHVRQHMNMKPFQCHVCVQTFYSEYKRNKHMKIFHGGRFVCKLCKNTFAGRSDLKVHIGKSHVLGF